MVIAVSTFSVLAGGNSPWASLAASTAPVLALAIRYAEAGTTGSSRAPRGGYCTTMPRLASRGPPTWFLATGCGWLAAATAGFDVADTVTMAVTARILRRVLVCIRLRSGP